MSEELLLTISIPKKMHLLFSIKDFIAFLSKHVFKTKKSRLGIPKNFKHSRAPFY